MRLLIGPGYLWLAVKFLDSLVIGHANRSDINSDLSPDPDVRKRKLIFPDCPVNRVRSHRNSWRKFLNSLKIGSHVILLSK